MYCQKCGAEVTEGRFCQKCGSQLCGDTNQPQMAFQTQQQPYQQSQQQYQPQQVMQQPFSQTSNLNGHCPKCGGIGEKKYKAWQIIVAILFFPIGLIALFIPKENKCTNCKTWF